MVRQMFHPTAHDLSERETGPTPAPEGRTSTPIAPFPIVMLSGAVVRMRSALHGAQRQALRLSRMWCAGLVSDAGLSQRSHRMCSSAALTPFAVDDLSSLVEQVLGELDPLLPDESSHLTLLIAGLRHHLPSLERLVEAAAPYQVQQARRVREPRPPTAHMARVIYVIRLAEAAQDLINAVAPTSVPHRTPACAPLSAGRTAMEPDGICQPPHNDERNLPPAPRLTPVLGPVRDRALQRRTTHTSDEVAAAVASLCDCGPPPV